MHELWVAGDSSGSVRTVSPANKEYLLPHFSIFTSLLVDRQELQLILFAFAGLSSLITPFSIFLYYFVSDECHFQISLEYVVLNLARDAVLSPLCYVASSDSILLPQLFSPLVSSAHVKSFFISFLKFGNAEFLL